MRTDQRWRGQMLGYNEIGEVGNGTFSTDVDTPSDVTGLGSDVGAISAGGDHTCALTKAGAVECWGQDAAFRNGYFMDSSMPVDVAGLGSGVSVIAAGAFHTCALMKTGAVECWGDNEFGELGDGTTTTSSTAVDVRGLTSGVVAISAGGYHTCALTSAGAVECWGWNAEGQLGDGSTANSSIPVGVSGLSSGVATISAGWQHTCAVMSVGSVMCWGLNAAGQLGDGNRISPNPARHPGRVSADIRWHAHKSPRRLRKANTLRANAVDS
jgi:alpha-tubulin suppressor-like RCC1 family protein